jgi:ferredoxin
VNLLSVADRLNTLDATPVHFTPERCLHALDKDAACTACADACPVQAITPGHPPVFQPDRCKNCLACIPACPTGAFDANDGVSALLACAARVDSKKIELLCALHPQPRQGAADAAGVADAAGITVRSCLAGLGSGALIALASLGAEEITLRTEICKGCPWSCLQTQIAAQAAEAQQILAGWEPAAQIALCSSIEKPVDRPLWKSTQPPLSRRDFFRSSAAQGKASLAQAIDSGEAPQPNQPGRNRLRMLKSAYVLPELTRPDAALPQNGFALLQVSDKCTACSACARACPTQALVLQKDADKNQYLLAFYPQNCIACGACTRSCAVSAAIH